MSEPITLTPEQIDALRTIVISGKVWSEATFVAWRRAPDVVAVATALLAAVSERDEARRMLGDCYVLTGNDTDGDPPESIHVWAHALTAVREMRDERDTAAARAEAAEREAARLRDVLDAERGVRGPKGWTWNPEEDGEDEQALAYWASTSGYATRTRIGWDTILRPNHIRLGVFPTALDAMEAADAERGAR